MTDKFDQTEPTKPTEPQKSEVVKIMEQAPSTEKTLMENIIDLEGAVASIVAKKVSKKIPEVDILFHYILHFMRFRIYLKIKYFLHLIFRILFFLCRKHNL
jgi:hypothetical protein